MNENPDDLIKEVAIMLCEIHGEDPRSTYVCNVVDRSPPDHWKDRVNGSGIFRWENWEGRTDDAKRLVKFILGWAAIDEFPASCPPEDRTGPNLT